MGESVNLYDETLDAIERYGYKYTDVMFVEYYSNPNDYLNSSNIKNIKFSDFSSVAVNIYYVNDSGSDINQSLKIVFYDKNFLERKRYNGITCWELVRVPSFKGFDNITSEDVENHITREIF